MQAESDELDYRNQVAEALRTGGEVQNFSNGHASILLDSIIDASNHTVDILTNSLDVSVFGSARLIESAQQFLLRKGRLRIAIEEDIDWCELRIHPFIDAIIDRCPWDNLYLRSAQNFKQEHQHNFAVGDQAHVRYEADRSKVEAEGWFRNLTRTSQFTKLFEVIWSKTSEIRGREPAPQRIKIAYEKVGDTYLFSSSLDLPGLHICDLDFVRGLLITNNVQPPANSE